MGYVNIEDFGDVAILRLDNGITNPISLGLVKDLDAKIVEVSQRYKAVVLAGNAKFFSIGLNLPELIQLDRLGMTDFIYQFNKVSFDLFALSIPTVCALAGHAIAGGAVFALTCDYRIGAEGKKKIGLNEIKLGVPVPYLTDLILRETVGERNATDMIYRGKFINVAEANDIGLVDRMVSQEEVETAAFKLASQLATMPAMAFSAIKAHRIEAIRLRYEKNFESTHEVFLDCWFDDSVQQLLIDACSTF